MEPKAVSSDPIRSNPNPNHRITCALLCVILDPGRHFTLLFTLTSRFLFQHFVLLFYLLPTTNHYFKLLSYQQAPGPGSSHTHINTTCG